MIYPRLLCAAMALTLAGCGDSSKFRTYDGPEVTQILVDKSDRKMWLLHETTVLESYDIRLGFAPEGDKFVEGDGRTPEGLYHIDRRNPNSRYHLSLGISYPNERDLEEARTIGGSPGGDIFIHGTPEVSRRGGPAREGDWTWGCIAVLNHDIEEIYAMVDDGTPIWIQP